MLNPKQIGSDLISLFNSQEKKFKRCATNNQRINFFLKQVFYDVPTISKFTKDDNKAIQLKQDGNIQFKQKKYFNALETYTLAIARARTKTTAVLIYANRSALLYKLGLYKECIEDIDRAFNDSEEKLRTKLKLRRQDAAQKLKKIPIASQSLKKNYSNNLIKIAENQKYGRHIIAAKDLEIGQLLVVERPLVTVLQEDDFIYCHECLSVCYNLIPCDRCSKVLYCGNTCKEKSWQSYHNYECGLFETLSEFLQIKDHLSFSLKLTLSVINSQEKIKNFKKFITHCDKRPLLNLYICSWISSAVFNLLQQKTKFFNDFKGLEDRFKDLFLTSLFVTDVYAVAISRLEPTEANYNIVLYAAGLYELYSLFNHSCYPNVFFYYVGSTLFIRAIQNIKKGEQCFVSYGVSSIMPKIKRQELLLRKYYFTCTCRACAENWQVIEETDKFDAPYALVQMAILKYDHELLANIVPTFINRFKSLDYSIPSSTVLHLKQLIIDCYQIYECPRNLDILK